MFFVDNTSSRYYILLLFVTALLIYSANISLSHLRKSDEALNAAYTQEFLYGNNITETSFYGTSVKGYPLYPWLAALCSLPKTCNTSIRLPALLALFALAAISGIFAWKIQSAFAGVVSASVVLLSTVSFKIGILANTDIVVSFLLTAAWFALYVLGWVKKRWILAWTLAMTLLFIASFGWGIKAYVIFYLPLFFLWNRLDGFEALQSPHHFIAVIITLVLFVLRGLFFPSTPFLPWKALAFVNPPENLADYLLHLISMLPKIAYYLFPWTLMAWAPYCLALRQLEDAKKKGDKEAPLRSCCHYLRVLVSTCFVIFWLLPGGSPLNLLPVFGPFAVLIGVHSEILLRRHRDFFSSMLRFTAWICFILSIISVIICCLCLTNIFLIDFMSKKQICFSLALSIISFLVVSFAVLFEGGHLSFRACIIWVIFSCAILHTAIWRFPVATLQQAPQECAEMLSCNINRTNADQPQTLHQAMQQDNASILYLSIPNLLNSGTFLIENFYLDTQIRHISDMQEDLPKDDKVVYVMSPFLPALQERDWKAFSKIVQTGYTKGVLLNFNGFNKLCNRPLSPILSLTAHNIQRYNNPPEMRIYKGILREN